MIGDTTVRGVKYVIKIDRRITWLPDSDEDDENKKAEDDFAWGGGKGSRGRFWSLQRCNWQYISLGCKLEPVPVSIRSDSDVKTPKIRSTPLLVMPRLCVRVTVHAARTH